MITPLELLNGPVISHLCLADDSLFFIEAKREVVDRFMKILNWYTKVSG